VAAVLAVLAALAAHTPVDLDDPALQFPFLPS
jgi:hypothetical protein